MYSEGTWTIGSVVKFLREEQEITGAQLSYGLCSASTLSRIEAGEREMNVIFSMILFGRLGYHPDKFELYGSKEEYSQYEQRESMQNFKKSQDYKQIELELAQYKKSWQKDIQEDTIQQQFVNSMEGLLCLQKGDYKRSIELLEKAVTVTIPEWDTNWVEKAVVSETELDIMSILADALAAIGNKEKASIIWTNILTYIEQKTKNPVQMLQIYTKTICDMIPILLERKNTGFALELCQKGLDALSEKGRMYHWEDLLYWKGRCLEELYRIGKEKLDVMKSTYIRAFYIYRFFGNYEMAKEVKSRLDKEVPGWECIKLEKL